MTQLILPDDPVARILPRLREVLPKIHGGPVVVRGTLPKDPVSTATVHLYLAGGYSQSLVTHRATILCHCYASDGPSAYSLAAAVAATIRAGGEHFWGASVITGPYDNPHPDYPDAHRFSLSVEVTVGRQIASVD